MVAIVCSMQLRKFIEVVKPIDGIITSPQFLALGTTDSTFWQNCILDCMVVVYAAAPGFV